MLFTLQIISISYSVTLVFFMQFSELQSCRLAGHSFFVVSNPEVYLCIDAEFTFFIYVTRYSTLFIHHREEPHNFRLIPSEVHYQP